MELSKLTKEQRVQVAREELALEPTATIGHCALLKLGEIAINTGAKDATLTTEATFKGQRYKLKSVVTYKKIKGESGTIKAEEVK